MTDTGRTIYGGGAVPFRVPSELGVPLKVSTPLVLSGSVEFLTWDANDDTGETFPAGVVSFPE